MSGGPTDLSSQPAGGPSSRQCGRCGAAVYATDAVCMSCGADLMPPRPSAPREPGSATELPVAPASVSPTRVPGGKPTVGERAAITSLPDLCGLIVERFGAGWGYLGWLLFLSWYLGPLLIPGLSQPAVWWTLIALTAVWWNIDVIEQQVPAWQVALGGLMLTIGFLPRGGFLILACWVIYWTRVRE